MDLPLVGPESAVGGDQGQRGAGHGSLFHAALTISAPLCERKGNVQWTAQAPCGAAAFPSGFSRPGPARHGGVGRQADENPSPRARPPGSPPGAPRDEKGHPRRPDPEASAGCAWTASGLPSASTARRRLRPLILLPAFVPAPVPARLHRRHAPAADDRHGRLRRAPRRSRPGPAGPARMRSTGSKGFMCSLPGTPPRRVSAPSPGRSPCRGRSRPEDASASRARRPGLWVAERTFGRLRRCRRLASRAALAWLQPAPIRTPMRRARPGADLLQAANSFMIQTLETAGRHKPVESSTQDKLPVTTRQSGASVKWTPAAPGATAIA